MIRLSTFDYTFITNVYIRSHSVDFMAFQCFLSAYMRHILAWRYPNLSYQFITSFFIQLYYIIFCWHTIHDPAPLCKSQTHGPGMCLYKLAISCYIRTCICVLSMCVVFDMIKRKLTNHRSILQFLS